MRKIRKRILGVLLLLVVLYLLLLIPDSNKPAVIRPAGRPFAWNQDSVWQLLESDFTKAKKQDKAIVDSGIDALFSKEAVLYNSITINKIAAADSSLNEILINYFQLAALIAAQPEQRNAFLHYYNQIRNTVKLQSQHWDMNNAEVRNNIYQMLYGMRAAAEEVLLQTADKPFDAAINLNDEPSAAPFTNILGIKVYSGDLLVSRGGAEVSALISRGNNYPGNFSHVALIYVEEKSNRPYLIEAHIEKGVAVSSVAQYIKDKKLRFMVLRPRVGLPQLQNDPWLPHKAAKLAYEKAMQQHIPYDFKMNFYDTTAMFCSEVGSYAYKRMGIQLWNAVSTISSQGVVNWLSAFGVENFVTQMPSDLEYDPQLSVVAEWRNPETLMKDHIDNAVMDVLLEQANKGKIITYNLWQLPFVRVIKLWCMIKNSCGSIGIIPEGMSATQALKNQNFVAMYNTARKKTDQLVRDFEKDHNYKPPYWQLINLAKGACEK